MTTKRTGLAAMAVAALLGCHSAGEEVSTTTGTSTSSSTGGAGGAACLGPMWAASAGAGATGGMGAGYVPTPANIAFAAKGAAPSGEQILFNDWAIPNEVKSMAPDGSQVVSLFTAFRVWSMGVNHAATKLAFACGDPKQKQHYGTDLGDAIQHTWLYDFATQKVELLAAGNINDECYQFDACDAFLFVCRRYDFTAQNTNKTYRLGRLRLSDRAFDFIGPESTTTLQLHPQPTADGSALFFTRIVNATQASLRRMPLPPGADALVIDKAHSPVISPDGKKLLYGDDAQKGVLRVADLDGKNAVTITSVRGTAARFSPDGKKVAYLRDAAAMPCQHVEIVAADGSEAAAPKRIRDCTQTGEFITQLAWIARK